MVESGHHLEGRAFFLTAPVLGLYRCIIYKIKKEKVDWKSVLLFYVNFSVQLDKYEAIRFRTLTKCATDFSHKAGCQKFI